MTPYIPEWEKRYVFDAMHAGKGFVVSTFSEDGGNPLSPRVLIHNPWTNRDRYELGGDRVALAIKQENGPGFILGGITVLREDVVIMRAVEGRFTGFDDYVEDVLTGSKIPGTI